MAAWILEGLKKDYDLTVLAFEQVDLPAINRFYGTSLGDPDVSVIYPNYVVRTLLGLDPDKESIQPAAYLMRMCRRIRHGYDLVIAAGMEEMDLGGPGLLYVHYPHLARFWVKYCDTKAGWPGFLRGKIRPWTLLSGYSVDRMRGNSVLANSDWTRARIQEAYAVPVKTLYPPVTASSRTLPWELREDHFVCIGRFQARKRMDWVISILRKVREQHRRIRLHLIGTRDQGREAARYYRMLRELVAADREWVRLHEDLPRTNMLELMGRSRYAIHALKEEHFGLAPAEALMAGCIPFVHDSGGQVEIVGGEPLLCYRDQEATEKIGAVLGSKRIQNALRTSLAQRRSLFTVERFVEGLQEAVRSALATPVSRD